MKARATRIFMKLYVRGEMRRVELIDGKMGTWYDAAKFAPRRNGSYLVIMETTSPARHCQSWGGMGEVETTRYNDNFDTSKNGVNWEGRGSLNVAFWTPKPEFNLRWDPREGARGEWVEKPKYEPF